MVSGNPSSSYKEILKILKKSAIYSLIPIFFFYILLDKPDYKIINALRAPVIYVAEPVGQVISWPVRAIINMVKKIGEYNNVLTDNHNLRMVLDEKLQREAEYNYLKVENQRLQRMLNVKQKSQYDIVFADIINNNSGIKNSFIINIGVGDDIKKGEVVLSERGNLIGFIDYVGSEYSRVRSLSDINSNIIIRVAGTGVFGFLQGNSTSVSYFEYYSDPNFEPIIGAQVVSSPINSLMPEDIPIGVITKVYSKSRSGIKTYDSEFNTAKVQVIKFNYKDKYKKIIAK